MISALHLIWIIPSTFIFVFMFAALFQTAKHEDEKLEDVDRKGVK